MKKAGKKSGHSDIRKSYTGLMPSKKERCEAFVKALAIEIALVILFYNRIAAMAALIPVVIFFYRKLISEVKNKKKRQMKSQFRDVLVAVSDSVTAGYSQENAWKNVYKEMLLTTDPDTPMMQELYLMKRKLELNENLEDILDEFARRTQMEEAKSFSGIFRFAKRSGGNMKKIMETAAEHIGDKIEVDREIEVVTADKRLEMKVMLIAPIGILAYLRLTSPGYLDVLYGSLSGVCVMSVCLGIYLAAYFLAEKVITIEV